MGFDKMWSSLFIFLGLASVYASDCISEGNDCFENAFELCSSDFEISVDFLPYDETQLDSVCKKLQAYYECCESYDVSPDVLCGYPRNLFKNAEVRLGDVCNKTSYLRARYLDNLSCYKKAIDLVGDDCTAEAERMYNLLMTGARNVERTEKVIEIEQCIKMIQTNICHHESVESVCGDEAGIIFTAFLGTAKFYLLKCRDFDQFWGTSVMLIVLNRELKLHN